MAGVLLKTTVEFCEVVAVPVTFPEKAPENVVAVMVLFDGLILTVETVDIAAPTTAVVAGVNKIG